jgi:hypothetical protein
MQFNDREYLLFVVLTNYLTIFSGVLFLLAFILLGLIALRVSRVFGVRTHWPLLFVGPVGAIVYSVYTIVHGGGPTGSKQAYALERWLAYGAFLVCGLLCWWGVLRFYRALGALAKEGAEVKKKYA